MGGMDRHLGGEGHLQQLPPMGWIWDAWPYTAANVAHTPPEWWLQIRKHSATTEAGLKRSGVCLPLNLCAAGVRFYTCCGAGFQGHQVEWEGQPLISRSAPWRQHPGHQIVKICKKQQNCHLFKRKKRYWTQIRASTLRTQGQIWPITWYKK